MGEGGGIMGYGILRSDKTGYRIGNRRLLQLELTGYGIFRSKSVGKWDTQNPLLMGLPLS